MKRTTTTARKRKAKSAQEYLVYLIDPANLPAPLEGFETAWEAECFLAEWNRLELANSTGLAVAIHTTKGGDV